MIIKLFVSLINLIIKSLGAIASFALSLLPPSPFKVLEGIEIPYLKSLNWVMPISFFLNVLTYWVLAIAVYYVVQVVLRWVKVVE